MWNLILLLYVFIIVWGLKINFKERSLIKSKILNLIMMLIFLFFLANNELFTLTSMVYNFTDIISKEYVKIGFMSAGISLTVFFLNLLVALIISIQIVGMIGLRDKAKNRFIKILPFYLLIDLFEGYKFFVRHKILEHYIYYGIIMIIISGLVLFLYSRSFMKEIFISKQIQTDKI